MITFYNLPLIESETVNDSLKFISIMTRLSLGKYLPKTTKERDITKMIGNSFLLNAKELLADKTVDINYKIQYIKLAAYRDYALYKLYKVTSLPLSYFPDIALDKIKHNPLLRVTQTDIHFKYER